MDENRNIEQILEDLAFDDAPDRGHRDRLEMKLLGHFNATRFRQHSRRKIKMNLKLVKLAAAAVIVMGVFLGLAVFNETSSVSWAQVRQQVAAVKAVMYKAQVNAKENGQPVQLQIEATLADEYGTRMDTYMDKRLLGSSFTLADKKTHIYVMPAQKKYVEVDLTEEIRIENGDPKLIVEAFLKGDYTELGRREIDGVTLKGIQSHDVSPTAGIPGGRGLMESLEGLSVEVIASLWVDVATGWPVEITLDIADGNGSEQMTIVVSDFQWDAQIDPTTFAPVIPEGYEPMYGVNAENLEEGNQLVEGLAYFAQINDGKYPAKLSVRDVVIEIGEIYRAKSGDPFFRIDDAQVSILKYGVQFFGTLQTEGKDPVYYGQTVTAVDANKVLLRWKLDNGQYRVILGDLRIQDVSPTRLAELETP
jgi:outer membrane lipoprotein-sorting protein